MGRFMALVVIVAILAVVVLAIWFSRRRTATRREDFRDLQRENARHRELIAAIQTEAQLAWDAYGTHGAVLDLINAHNRKELTL